jgi:hypothetical protein
MGRQAEADIPSRRQQTGAQFKRARLAGSSAGKEGLESSIRRVDFNLRPPPDIFGSVPMFREGAVLSRGPGPESSKAPHQPLSLRRQQF